MSSAKKAQETVERLREHVVKEGRKRNQSRKKKKRKAVVKGWTLAIYSLVVQWHNYAQVMSAQHDVAAEMQRQLHWGLTVPSIVFTTLSGAGGVGTASLFSGSNSTSTANSSVQQGLTIASTALSIFAALFIAMIAAVTPAANAEGHRVKGKDYDLMARRIQTELATPKKERMVGSDYVKSLVASYEELVEKKPYISKAKRLAPHNELDVPDVMGNDEEDDESPTPTSQEQVDDDDDKPVKPPTADTTTETTSSPRERSRSVSTPNGGGGGRDRSTSELAAMSKSLQRMQRKRTKIIDYPKLTVSNTPMDAKTEASKVKSLQREFAKRNKKVSPQREWVLKRLKQNKEEQASSQST